MKRILTVMLTACLLCALLGCSVSEAGQSTDAGGAQMEDAAQDAAEDTKQSAAEDTAQTETDADTQQTKNTPKVFVDADGYGADEKKTVYFAGNEESGTFQVVDADTRETVYTGTLRSCVSENSTGTQLQRGDFSSLTESGSYYIEAAHIGRSDTFQIGEGPFTGLRDTLLNAFKKEAEQTSGVFLYRAQTLSWMLRYQEYYGEETDSLQDGTPELLTLAVKLGDGLKDEWEEKTGETAAETELSEPEDAEVAYYGAAMAQLYEAWKEYDAAEANIFLKEAVSAYETLSKRRGTDFDEALLFYDAALLYRATGQSRYHNLIKTYLKSASEREFFKEDASEEALLSDEAYLYGAVVYLSALNKVDTTLCGSLMETLLEGAKQVEADCEANDDFSVSADRRNRMLSDRLYLVAIVEHVVVSKEYVEILQGGIHYINGRNESGVSLVSEDGVFDSTMDEKDSGAALGGAYLFILGEIIESEAEE